MNGDLTREDLLREEALVRARETCQFGGSKVTADEVVEHAKTFYDFLKG